MREALWKVKARLWGPGIARNVLGTRHPRAALLLYQVASFRIDRGRETHQNITQARDLARVISERGYDLDVVDYDERRADLLERDYHLVVDLHPTENPLYRDRLAPGAKRVSYITGSNPATANAAERARLTALQRRRGVRLAPRRQQPEFPPQAFAAFDAMFLFGGRFAHESYAALSRPPIHRLVNNGYDDVAPTDAGRRDPKRFLFLGGSGQVHKGLDLLLEAFADARDLELVVCSAYAKEPDFVRAYRRELFELPHVRAAGFVDVRSQRFRDLQADCGWMILPSCAEGQSGSVTVAMSYGLSPVVSEACGFDDHPEIMVLERCDIETIRATARELAGRSRSEVAAASARALALLRAEFRPRHYAASVQAGLDAVLAP